ncbi:hypothetical protein L6Q96_20765 [Candidatus Binatia bacterium]|nr:hypothetical protein [Candidatus Binatia bacterium]
MLKLAVSLGKWRPRVLTGAAALMLTATGQGAFGSTINVTSTSGGTGGPSCTLRDAIAAANGDVPSGGCSAGSGVDSIVLPSGAMITLVQVDNATHGANGLPVVTSTIVVEGNGATIGRSTAPATPVFRILHVDATGDLTLANLTITNGKITVPLVLGEGGGGILNWGNLTVTDSSVIGNDATAPIGFGFPEGGGISSPGTLLVERSTISGNRAGQGGGICAGWYLGGPIIPATTLVNTTVSGNSDDGNSGGGILYAQGILRLRSSSIIDNRGGIYNNFNSGGTVQNTILTRNGPYNCAGSLAFTSMGYNLTDDSTCGFLSGPGDQPNVANPQVGPLQDNGGPTATHALLSGSSAIDAGDPAGCADANSSQLATDQRGAPRSADGGGGFGNRCDIGAFEFDSLLPNGSPCSSDAQCASHLCTDGVCAVPVGAPALSPTMLLLSVAILGLIGMYSLVLGPRCRARSDEDSETQ